MKLFRRLRGMLNKRKRKQTELAALYARRDETYAKLAEPISADYQLQPGESVLEMLDGGEWRPLVFWRKTETGELVEVKPPKN